MTYTKYNRKTYKPFAIKKHPRVREQYATRLINEGVLNASEVEAQNKDAMSLNEQAFENYSLGGPHQTAVILVTPQDLSLVYCI